MKLMKETNLKDFKNSKFDNGDVFVKADNGAMYKILKKTFIKTITEGKAKKIRPVNDWLYDCETIKGDERQYVRYYESRLSKEFYKLPTNKEVDNMLCGS
jgi:hypothetical protein